MGFERSAVLMFGLKFGLQLFDEELEPAKLVAQFLDFAGGRHSRARRG